MVAPMSNRHAKDWKELESTADAVKRLTAMIDERNAKRASGALRPDKIQESRAHVPCVVPEESGDEPERMRRSAALDGSSPSNPGEGGHARDHTGQSGEKAGGWGGGRAASVLRESTTNGCARPDTPGFAAGYTDRDHRDAPEDW